MGYRGLLGLVLVMSGVVAEARAPACDRPRLKAAVAVPRAASGEVAIATQNLWNLFDDQDNGPGELLSAANYQRKLGKWSAQLREVLAAPAIVAVQEAENEAVLAALAARVAAEGGPRYQPYLVDGPDSRGIDVGYLVAAPWRVTRMTPLLTTRRRGPTPLFDRPPLLLEVARPDGQRLELVNVHLKSLNGSRQRPEAVRAKRSQQAAALAEWVRAHLAASPGAPLLLLGDFNATPEGLGDVDLLGALTASGLTLLTTRLPPAERYSYVFACRPEAIDHVLVAPALLPVVSRLAVSRGNADGHPRHETAPGPVRASDHDGLVVFLRLSPP
ncbi:MAG: endonuclease/exonuclease/phosphatase family protein [Moraxellaceae bacterium]